MQLPEGHFGLVSNNTFFPGLSHLQARAMLEAQEQMIENLPVHMMFWEWGKVKPNG